MNDPVGTVYLIHLNTKLSHAQHYVGFCEGDVNDRLLRHRRGNGSKMLRACNNEGIPYQVSRIWENKDRAWERKLKSMKNTKRYCPLCCKKPMEVR